MSFQSTFCLWMSVNPSEALGIYSNASAKVSKLLNFKITTAGVKPLPLHIVGQLFWPYMCNSEKLRNPHLYCLCNVSAVLNLIWWRCTYSLPSICEYFCGHCFCTITQLGTTVSFCSTYVNNNNSESLLLLLDRYRLKNNVWDCWGDRYIRHRQTNAKDALESTKCDNIKHVLTEFFYSFQGLICFFLSKERIFAL